MGLPMLTYFEKKYPGSYKYWVIEKKCAMSAPFYFNHPLIDRIKITDKWSGFGEEDRRIMSECDIVCIREGWKHSSESWYNEKNCVEETAFIAGITDIKNILTEEELKPILYRWFNIGFNNPNYNTYSKNYKENVNEFENNIAIYPFASGAGAGRSPSIAWWKKMITILIDNGYTVFHYGRPTDPILSTSDQYVCYIHLSLFEQMQATLCSKVTIGTDSGAMWLVGAYSHPAIHLMTNWMPNHRKNFLALEPVNKCGKTLFEQGGCDNIQQTKVLDMVNDICEEK
jgi:hypothetical protein